MPVRLTSEVDAVAILIGNSYTRDILDPAWLASSGIDCSTAKLRL